MHTIDTLQGKKAALVAQRDQLMGQFNMTLGAIAIVDELLGDMHREAETQKQLDQVAKDMAAEAKEKARLLPDQSFESAMAKLHEPDPPTAPEMPAVSHDVEDEPASEDFAKYARCVDCDTPVVCAGRGCARPL